MDKVLDYYLVKKYPKIFVNRHADMKTTAMCWGFECSDGWFNLLNRACSLIQGHIDSIEDKNARAKLWKERISANDWENVPAYIKNEYDKTGLLPEEQPVHQVVATQIKEKFGTLRFYVNGADEYCYGIINFAESMSGCTCEVCGQLGTLQNEGWMKTRCEKHEDNDYPIEKEELKDANPQDGDEIRALFHGGYETIKITKVISCNEIEGVIEKDDWDNKKSAIEKGTVVKAKYCKHKLCSFWDGEDIKN